MCSRCGNPTIAHGLCRKCYSADWYRARRDERLAHDRAYYAANRERILARHRARYVKNHPNRRDVEPLALRAKGPKLSNAEIKRRYRRRHPERVRELERAQRSRRRAKRRGSGGRHSVKEWYDKCMLLGWVCFYCGESRPLVRDHKIPICRGGSDFISNVVPACQPCNQRKGTRTAREYLSLRDGVLARASSGKEAS